IKFVDFVWKDIVDVYTKEEIIGAIFSVKTTDDTEVGIDYLPKIQARKLYQYAQERKELEREARRLRALEEKQAESGSIRFENVERSTPEQPVVKIQPPSPTVQEVQKPDELTEKLKKLKMLFDNGLITQEEYNHKKLDLLNEL
ncbi:MAG TPA: SHOCT domain-containing protein, partial [Mucilaginibacter sp.]